MLLRRAILPTVRPTLLCALWWAASAGAVAATPPVLSVDLLTKGMHADSSEGKSYKTCPYQYFGYRAVEWLDAQQILVAFSTTPHCATKEGILTGKVRLVTFSLDGRPLHSTDLPYDAGEGLGVRMIQHDGVWIGPGRSVIVEVPGSRLKAQPNSRDKVVVLSSELSSEQEIDTDSHEAYYDGIHFAGVTGDHQAVLFWTSDGVIGHARSCLVFNGKPLKQMGTCLPQDLESLDPTADYKFSVLLPKNYQVRAFAGRSMHGERISLFAVKEGGFLGACDIVAKFCPSDGELIVFDTNTNRPVLRRRLPLSGRAALSPTGKHLAVMENNRLEVFPLP